MARMLQHVICRHDDEWSQKGVNKLKKKIFDVANLIDPHIHPRILFLGQTGVGKSSYISSVISAFRGEITYVSPVGVKEGEEFNNTQKFLEHRIHEKDPEGRGLNFTLCDTRGLSKQGQRGTKPAEIPRLIEGKLHHNDDIKSEMDPNNFDLIEDIEPNEACCVVFVEKAKRSTDVHHYIQGNIEGAKDLLRKKGIPYCLVMTHLDEMKPKLKNDLKQAVKSRTVKELIKSRATAASLNENRVFIVKCYTSERETHPVNDVCVLRALKAMLSDAIQRFGDHRLPRSKRPEFTQTNSVSRTGDRVKQDVKNHRPSSIPEPIPELPAKLRSPFSSLHQPDDTDSSDDGL